MFKTDVSHSKSVIMIVLEYYREVVAGEVIILLL